MVETQIEHHAESVLRTLDMWRLPVDPFSIAREEEIELAPGEFGSGFDGRIKYLREIDSFVIHYADVAPGRGRGRVKFTLAHELAHFYLHKSFLLKGQFHDSIADFRSKDAIEREADEFAAALLMPEPLFVQAVKQFRQSVCTLGELCQLADRFETSLTSTVRRYCQCCIEPCSMVVSENGRLKWALHSEDMKRLGMGFIECRNSPRVPRASKTAKLWARLDETEDSDAGVEGELDATVWFDRPYKDRLWEEAMPLGYTGLVLTYLTVSD